MHACMHGHGFPVNLTQDDRRYRAWLSNLEAMVKWNLRPNPPFLKGMNGLRCAPVPCIACCGAKCFAQNCPRTVLYVQLAYLPAAYGQCRLPYYAATILLPSWPAWS